MGPILFSFRCDRLIPDTFENIGKRNNGEYSQSNASQIIFLVFWDTCFIVMKIIKGVLEEECRFCHKVS